MAAAPWAVGAHRAGASPRSACSRCCIPRPPCSKPGRFPSIYDAPSVLVSVIVPAYNESERITPMMDEMLAFLRSEEKKDK